MEEVKRYIITFFSALIITSLFAISMLQRMDVTDFGNRAQVLSSITTNLNDTNLSKAKDSDATRSSNSTWITIDDVTNFNVFLTKQRRLLIINSSNDQTNHHAKTIHKYSVAREKDSDYFVRIAKHRDIKTFVLVASNTRYGLQKTDHELIWMNNEEHYHILLPNKTFYLEVALLALFVNPALTNQSSHSCMTIDHIVRNLE